MSPKTGSEKSLKRLRCPSVHSAMRPSFFLLLLSSFRWFIVGCAHEEPAPVEQQRNINEVPWDKPAQWEGGALAK